MSVVDNKARAHVCLSSFHTILEDYESGLLDPGVDKMPVSYSRVMQTMVIEAYQLIKYLHGKEPCKATKAYLMNCGRLLVRLRHLVHNGRKETDAEHGEYMAGFMKKHGLVGEESGKESGV